MHYLYEMQDKFERATTEQRPGITPFTERHPLAVLRRVIGKTQPAMAKMLGCSAATIQSIEVGRLKMSESLAQKISRKTDISPAWLLQGDSVAPPVDTTGAPYTQESFELNQPILHPLPVIGVSDWLSGIWRQVLGILASAHKRGELPLCEYKLKESLRALEKRFGYRDCSKMVAPDLIMIPEIRMGLHQVFTPVETSESNEPRKMRKSCVAKKRAE